MIIIIIIIIVVVLVTIISVEGKNRGYLISETRRSKLFYKYYSSLQNSQSFIPLKFNHIKVTLIKRVTTKNWPELKLSKKQQFLQETSNFSQNMHRSNSIFYKIS